MGADALPNQTLSAGAIMISIAWIWGMFVFLQNTTYLIFSVAMLSKFKKTFQNFENEIQAPLKEYPGISILTSVRGTSMPLEEGLSCLMKQDYPGPMELIIAVEDSKDPGYALAKQILDSAPHRMEIKWVLDFKPVGGNPRTAKMAYAAKYAQHEWIYWLAADTHSSFDHIRKMMHKTKADPNTYASAIPVQTGGSTLGALFETIPLVWEIPMFGLLNKIMKKPFVYGGSILFHMSLLKKAGGFEPILNYLTEEVPMTDGFTKVGGKGEIVPSLVWVRQDKQSLWGFYERKLRWAMIGRFHHPQLYYMGFVYSVMWLPIIWAITGNPIFLQMLGIFLIVKALVVYSYHAILGLPRWQWKWSVLMIPYEFICFTFCVDALFRKRVNWAGDVMRVDSTGFVTREA